MDETRKLSMEELEKVAGGAYVDEERICTRCGQFFMVTAVEQEYYADKGLTASDMCRQCRDDEKRNKGKTPVYYESVCPGCGQSFKIPFKLEPGQVIYCSECTSAMGG